MEQERFKAGQQPDLSSLQHAINAAEPVDYHAIMNFYEIFTQYGIKPDVIFPTYGLAEHTVFVCSGGRAVIVVKKVPLEKGIVEVISEEQLVYNDKKDGKNDPYLPEETQRIVGCGIPGHENDVRVVIVNSENEELIASSSSSSSSSSSTSEELRVGEIWISSPSKAKGYWNNPQQSKHDFDAELQHNDSDLSKYTYLRTGDLGFLYKKELFICGRLKDLIIVGGTNHYPQDIERTIERGLADQLRAGCSAAFSLSPSSLQQSHKASSKGGGSSSGRGSEEVIYVAEVKEDISADQYDYIVSVCRELVSIEHGIGLKTICLLETRTIPKTTSGKIARAWCRKAFLEKKLSILYRSDAEYSENVDYSAGSVPASTAGRGIATGGGGAGMEAETNSPSKQSAKEGTGSKAGGESESGPLSTGGKGDARTGGGYSAVPSNEAQMSGDGGRDTTGAGHPGGLGNEPKLSQEEIRALSPQEIIQKLEKTLIQVSTTGPSKLTPPLDVNTPLTSYGLDSMTLVQFKGVLEHRLVLFSPVRVCIECSLAFPFSFSYVF
jgi:hypothetical protein